MDNIVFKVIVLGHQGKYRFMKVLERLRCLPSILRENLRTSIMLLLELNSHQRPSTSIRNSRSNCRFGTPYNICLVRPGKKPLGLSCALSTKEFVASSSPSPLTARTLSTTLRAGSDKPGKMLMKKQCSFLWEPNQISSSIEK